jgi:hypothetical protein
MGIAVLGGSFLALSLLLTGSASRAQTPPPLTALGAPPRASERLVGGDFLHEGFDETFPPAEWTRHSTRSIPYTWHSVSVAPYVYHGVKSAVVKWRSERTQDERLISPLVDLGSATPDGLYLSFWYYTDPFWFGGADTDFRVEGSLDGDLWDELWSVRASSETGWVWRNVVIDVSSYAGGEGDFRARFRYEALDAADVALDEVKLGYLVPPGPPDNDDCAGALADEPSFTLGPQPGTFLLTGNNTFANLDYPLESGTSCTGFSHSGRDLVWIVDVPGGHHFTATMSTIGGWDDTLFLIGDCSDAQGSCVAGDRRFPDGSSVTWANPGTEVRRFYLVASAHSTGTGEFTIEASITQETARSPSSWGQVKARYR